MGSAQVSAACMLVVAEVVVPLFVICMCLGDRLRQEAEEEARIAWEKAGEMVEIYEQSIPPKYHPSQSRPSSASHSRPLTPHPPGS